MKVHFRRPALDLDVSIFLAACEAEMSSQRENDWPHWLWRKPVMRDFSVLTADEQEQVVFALAYAATRLAAEDVRFRPFKPPSAPVLAWRVNHQ